MDLRLTVDTGVTRDDVTISAPFGTSLTTIGDRLAEVVGIERGQTWWAGRRPLPPTALLGGPGLRRGDVVSPGRPGPVTPTAEPARGLLHLAVVAGPDCGRMMGVERGVYVIGRSDDCDLPLHDADVSRRHAVVTVTAAGASLRDLGSTNGTRVHTVLVRAGSTDGGPTDAGSVDNAKPDADDASEGTPDRRAEHITVVDADGCDLTVDDVFRIGDTQIALRAHHEPRCAVRATADGRVAVVRSISAPDDGAGAVLAEPVDPSTDRRPRIAWIAALLPAVAGVVFALALHTWQFLAFAALSPLTMIGTAAGDRWSWRRSRRVAARDYDRSLAGHVVEVAAGLAAERRRRCDAAPDLATVAAIAATPSARLWPHHRSDQFRLRLGCADRPSSLMIGAADGAERSAGSLAQVPVTADLAVGPLGIAGPPERVAAIVRAGLAGAAVARSPADLRIVLLLSDGCDTDWSWLRWLPHDLVRAANPDARAAALAQLQQQIAASARPARPASLASQRCGGGWTLVVVDRVGVLHDDPGFAEVLNAGADARIVVLCLDDTLLALPAACASLAVVDASHPTRISLSGTGWGARGGPPDVLNPVVSDQVDEDWAEGVARALAPLSDPGGAGTDELPAQVRLADLLRPAAGSAHHNVTTGAGPVRDRPDAWSDLDREWARAEEAGFAPLRTPIGSGVGGDVSLDLTADGPHALVAGTTGSGKSELLQSWIAGLAARFAPDDVQFLLVDYKGGAAFGAAAGLPHVAGLVTDLDSHLTERVLRSLDAELRSRERRLAQAAVPDLRAHRGAGSPGGHLPRVVVVVDEFATLAAELPEFVPGLVDVAQRGRSLGLHLVLATQRPGHIVSPAIRANTSLRIALRVADPGESTDVIGVPDAASLPAARPGRAVVCTADGIEVVQTGRITMRARDGVNVHVRRAATWEATDRTDDTSSGPTDLDQLAGCATAAWQARLATGASATVPPIWRPALPEVLVWDDDAAGSPRRDLVVGRRDRPGAQEQRPETWNLDEGGTTLLIGAARSGRTTALRTVVTAALRAGAAVAAVDSGGGLRSSADVPGVVGHVSANDADRLVRFLELLEGETEARRADLGNGDLDPLVVVVDEADAVLTQLDDIDAGRGSDRFLRILRAAGSAGTTIVLAGDRSLLAPRVVACAERVLTLRMADRADHSLVGIAARDVPGRMPPGRAIEGSTGDHIQFAVAGGVRDVAEQWTALRAAADRPRAGSAAPPAVGGRSPSVRLATTLAVRPLPEQVALHELASRRLLVSDGSAPPSGSHAGRLRNPLGGDTRHSISTGDGVEIAVGVGGDLAEAVSLDPWAGMGRLLVAGPPRSGRSTALASLAAAASAAGAQVWWWARSASPLAQWAQTPRTRESRTPSGPPGTPGPTPTAGTPEPPWASGSAPVALDRDGDTWPTPPDHGRVIVLLDDVDELLDSALSELVAQALRTAAPTNRLVVVCAGRAEELLLAYRGIVAEVRRGRRGLLLHPGPGDGELLGIRTGRRSRTPAGRGVLVAEAVTVGGRPVGATPIPIQIAVPTSVPGADGPVTGRPVKGAA